MDANITVLSALCLFFLAMSAFFSLSETALFSIPRERIDSFKRDETGSRRLIYSLLLDGQRTLLLILLGNLFVNITLAGLVTALMTSLVSGGAVLWSFLVTSAALVVIGDILPKNIALVRNEAIAAVAAPVIHVMKAVAAPLLNLVLRVNRFFLEHFKRYLRKPSPFITVDELKSAVRSSFERGIITKSEEGVITGLLDRGAQPVKRFMLHRSQVPFLPHYTTVADALAELTRRRQTCALITRGPRNHQVTGVVRLPELLGARRSDRCRQLAQAPQWIPETLEAADLIGFMFANKLGVVCVLDEFGGLSGVFSLEEGLSRVMNFQNERRKSGSSGGSVRVFAGLQEIDGMEGWLPETLLAAVPNARTLNGVLTRYLGRIPKTGERFDIDGKNFYIMYSGPSRIESVLIRKDEPQDADPAAQSHR
jgi:CBS domain containing-hemolysin-like protein